MKVTGHKSRSVFDRYHIVSPEDLTEPLEGGWGAIVDAMYPRSVAGLVYEALDGLKEVGVQAQEAVDPGQLGIGGGRTPRSVAIILS